MAASKPVGLGLRFGCILYDLIVLAAIWWAASMPFAAVDLTVPGTAERLMYQGYLGAVAVAYFVGCWRWRGATVGMRAWQVRLETCQGGGVGWTAALRRAFTAMLSWGCLGLGYWWCLFDPQRLCWHDRWSATRLVRPH